jgi:molecular chaperone DnaJ
MDKNKNYYQILEINNNSDINEIKKSYRRLSKKYHPDVSKENDAALIFSKITQAYDILSSEELRREYDLKSKWGRNYDETYELFDINIDFSYNQNKEQLDKFKKFQINNIQINIEDDFNGYLEYERWVKCKTCDGTGKDIQSKIIIKDKEGNTKFFEPDDGCDFCNGTGKDYKDKECYFCKGHGRIGINNCKVCKGEKRILGKQKLKNIKLTGTETKIDTMGHFSKDGVVGYLLLIKK